MAYNINIYRKDSMKKSDYYASSEFAGMVRINKNNTIL